MKTAAVVVGDAPREKIAQMAVCFFFSFPFPFFFFPLSVDSIPRSDVGAVPG